MSGESILGCGSGCGDSGIEGGCGTGADTVTGAGAGAGARTDGGAGARTGTGAGGGEVNTGAGSSILGGIGRAVSFGESILDRLRAVGWDGPVGGTSSWRLALAICVPESRMV